QPRLEVSLQCAYPQGRFSGKFLPVYGAGPLPSVAQESGAEARRSGSFGRLPSPFCRSALR
ncbi:MAG: hypothetical protein ACREP9_11035, partial [Candidatus Dormibacteraceae bacterium]